MMATNFKKKIKDRSGFSLAEVLVTVIILLLVTATVATGIPAASRAYLKVVDAANAQVLISTTIIRLREELGTADNVTTPVVMDKQKSDGSGTESVTLNTAISYDNSFGVRNVISLNDDGDKGTKGNIFIQEYAGFDPNGDFYHPLVSDSAAGKKLYITYKEITYSAGVVTFEELIVKNKITDQPLTEKMNFSIRVLTYIP